MKLLQELSNALQVLFLLTRLSLPSIMLSE